MPDKFYCLRFQALSHQACKLIWFFCILTRKGKCHLCSCHSGLPFSTKQQVHKVYTYTCSLSCALHPGNVISICHESQEINNQGMSVLHKKFSNHFWQPLQTGHIEESGQRQSHTVWTCTYIRLNIFWSSSLDTGWRKINFPLWSPPLLSVCQDIFRFQSGNGSSRMLALCLQNWHFRSALVG